MKKLLSVLLLLLTNFYVNAQWSTFPTSPINSTLYHGHLNSNVFSNSFDNNGNLFIATEYAGEISIQKFDSTGTEQWGPFGVSLTPAQASDRSPNIVADDLGGCYLSYITENDTDGAYVQHFDAMGTPLIVGNGKRLFNIISNYWEDLSFFKDGNNLFFAVTAEDSGTVTAVFTQKLDLNLNKLWGNNGKKISVYPTEDNYSRTISDGRSGMIVMYNKFFSPFNQVIKLQRLDSLGNTLWGQGVELNNSLNVGYCNRVIKRTSQNEIYVCWDGGGNAFQTGIYMNKVDSNGIRPWGAPPKIVFDTTGQQEYPTMQVDDFGNAYIAWRDFRAPGQFGCYTKKINNNGIPQWGNLPLALDTVGNNNYLFPKCVLENNLPRYFWSTYNQDERIATQLVDSTGFIYCAANGDTIGTEKFHGIIDDYVIPTPSGGYLIATELNFVNNSLYLQYITGSCNSMVGLNQINNKEKILVYPNPTNDLISFENKFENSICRVYNLDGRVVLNENLQKGTNTISLRTLDAGIYFLEIITSTKTYSTKILKL